MKQMDHNGSRSHVASSPDFRLLFESMPGYYLVVAPDMTIVAASEDYLRLTGTERRELIGRKIPVRPSDTHDSGGFMTTGVRTLAASLQKVLSSGLPDTVAVYECDIAKTDPEGGGFEGKFWNLVNTPVLAPDGTVCWIIHCMQDLTELARIKHEGREREKLLAALRDRTERLQAEVLLGEQHAAEACTRIEKTNAELTKLYEKTRELGRLRTSFLSNVSQEFRMALRSILEPLENALVQENSNLQGNDLREVHLNSLRLLKLVNSLLNSERAEGESIEVVREPTNLSQMTESLVEPFRSVIEKAGLELIIDCPPLPEPVNVDRSIWEKIVVSLVTNAFRFTFEGSIAVSIEWHAFRAVVLFRDTGDGIPQRELPRIFEPLHRIPSLRSRSSEGTYIEMCLVRKLIKQIGGAIDVWSEEGRGTTFMVSLPVGIPSTADSEVADDALFSPGSDKVFSSAEAPDIQGHILIVDNNPVTRDSLAGLLSPHFRVTLAESGAGALAALRTKQPDLVVSDVAIPAIGGLTLDRHLKANPQTGAIPFILIGSRGGEYNTVTNAEADDYLVRPFSARELLARVKTHMHISRVRRATINAERDLAMSRSGLLTKYEPRNKELNYPASDCPVNEPLPYVAGLIHILERHFGTPLDAKSRRYLSAIASAAREMDTLTDDLLNFSRISGVVMKKTSVNLRTLVLEVMDRFGECDSSVPTLWTLGNLPCVNGDLEMLRVVVAALISNALKFSSHRPERRIEIGATETVEGDVVFHVRDNGAGFNMEYEDKLFHVFQRLHSHEEFEGAGIGLAIVACIIRRHGGRTWATGIVDQGATFYCSLPPEAA